jgi:hypothetical protein
MTSCCRILVCVCVRARVCVHKKVNMTCYHTLITINRL